jgi:hypothetical protein
MKALFWGTKAIDQSKQDLSSANDKNNTIKIVIAWFIDKCRLGYV